jgi:hypothetical protein
MLELFPFHHIDFAISYFFWRLIDDDMFTFPVSSFASGLS